MNKKWIDRLEKEETLQREEWITLLKSYDEETRNYAAAKARDIASRYFGNKIYVRGLIEFTNYCKNDCYYCGIRRSNENVSRYRLTSEEILECCDQGYQLGFRTFVLQGGEDFHYSDEEITELIQTIKIKYPDCAITLSMGERETHSYQAYFQAGADRYLLRHETADDAHYRMLHPKELSLQNRKRCLQELKHIGYQVGCGFMVGSPGQTIENLAEDLLFIKELQPHMVGIGPFIPHHDTPFKNEKQGSLELTLFLLSLLRIMEKNVLLPATTALGTITPNGRELGILAGANVVMPNLSPISVRKKYMLYDDKICTGDETAEYIRCLTKRLDSIGYQIVIDRGDYYKA